MNRFISARRFHRVDRPHIFYNARTKEWDVHLPHDLSYKYNMTFKALNFAERLNNLDNEMKLLIKAGLT